MENVRDAGDDKVDILEEEEAERDHTGTLGMLNQIHSFTTFRLTGPDNGPFRDGLGVGCLHCVGIELLVMYTRINWPLFGVNPKLGARGANEVAVNRVRGVFNKVAAL